MFAQPRVRGLMKRNGEKVKTPRRSRRSMWKVNGMERRRKMRRPKKRAVKCYRVDSRHACRSLRNPSVRLHPPSEKRDSRRSGNPSARTPRNSNSPCRSLTLALVSSPVSRFSASALLLVNFLRLPSGNWQRQSPVLGCDPGDAFLSI